MSVYVGPGEGVEGEGCRPSIDIYIDICTGYMCLFLSLYKMFVQDAFCTWTYLSFCVDTYVYIYIYPDAFSTDSIRCIYPLLPFGRDIVETPKRLSTCVCMSLYRYISYIPAYTYTRTYVQPCQYACLPLCRVVDHGGCEYIDMQLYVIVNKAVHVCRLIQFHSISLYLYICEDVVPMFAQMHHFSVCIYSQRYLDVSLTMHICTHMDGRMFLSRLVLV